MKKYINLRVTHKLLWRLYGCQAAASFVSGLSILLCPREFMVNAACTILPYWLTGLLWLLCGAMIAGALVRWSYKTARLGLGISAVLYGLMGTGMLTDLLFSDGPPAPISTIIAHYILAFGAFFILLEPPINPETAIRNKNKNKE